MTLVIPEGFGNATFEFTCSEALGTFSTSIGFIPDGLFVGTEQDMCDAIADAFTATGRPFHADAILVHWSCARLNCVVTTGGEPVLATTELGIGGTSAHDGLVVNASMLVKKLTSLGGRKGRGRMYLPPAFFGEEQTDMGGLIDPTTRSNIQGFYDSARASLGSAEIIPKLLHSDSTTPTTINSFSVESRIATQRRRLHR